MIGFQDFSLFPILEEPRIGVLFSYFNLLESDAFGKVLRDDSDY